MDAETAARRWADTWSRAWPQRDAEAIAALYADTVVYHGAGHGFFYWHRPLYRPEQAMDGWDKIWAFFGKYLAK